MTATFAQARADIFSIISTAWTATTYPILWPDKPNIKPIARTPWARVTLFHNVGGQATLANHEGKSRYRREGVVTVQIFTPAGEGAARTYNLAKIISTAFEKSFTLKQIWFKNTRINEIGPDGDWYQINVLTNFSYDEVY